MGENGVDVRHDVLSVDFDRFVAAVAERGVEHGAVFGEVDFLPGEHGVSGFFDFAVAREGEEEFHDVAVDAVFGVVEEDVAIVWCFQCQAVGEIAV